MRKFAILAAAAALAIAAGQASAGEDKHAGESDLRRPAISIEAMKQKISALGYDVRRIKVDDGLFKVWLVERQFGGEVKAKFSAQSGELTKARLAH
ncbi:MAG: PepSY domain-containing protein [Pseudorhodoplanes sp.]|nr:PepSY domain-containing protein [Pseudorhodoplanes sp.]